MTDLVSFIDPLGVETVLTKQTDSDVLWIAGVTGRFMPPVDFVEDDVTGQAGVRVRAVRVRPRDVTFPLTVIGTDETSVRTKMRSLLRSFNPTRGEGRLRYTTVDGQTRDLFCRYSAGLEGIEGRDATGLTYAKAVVTFRAADPYLYDTTPTASTYTTGASTAFFPFFPMVLNSDTVIGTQTINNTGDVEAFPVWTINGPATSITLTNTTTGLVIDLPITLTAAQTVTIDTRPYHRTVTRDDGTNLYGSLSTVSALWSLPLGMSTVQVALPGATSASFVTLTYQRRWLTP